MLGSDNCKGEKKWMEEEDREYGVWNIDILSEQGFLREKNIKKIDILD